MNNYKKITLKNGMTLYFYKDENMKNVYFDFMIFYGSDGKWFDFNYDGKDYHVLPGVAHFLEHMLGEHSKNGNIYLNFARRNYRKNGQTSLNGTHYFFQGKTEVKESIKELIEAVEIPVFTPEDVLETSYAIAQETKMSRDNAQAAAFGLTHRNMYSNYEKICSDLSAIGSEKTTAALDYETLKLCYDAFYYDENKAMIIAGNLDEEEIVNYIESIYENIPRHEKKVKEVNVNRFGVRKDYDELEFDIKEDIHYLAYKTTIPEGFSIKEAYYYFCFYKTINLSRDSEFQGKCFDECILNAIPTSGFSFEDDCILLYLGVLSDELDKYKKALEDYLNVICDEETFEITRREYIADHARRYDDRFNTMARFYFNIKYTECFSDIEFFRTLTYDRYKEFVSKLNYVDKTYVKVKKK